MIDEVSWLPGSLEPAERAILTAFRTAAKADFLEETDVSESSPLDAVSAGGRTHRVRGLFLSALLRGALDTGSAPKSELRIRGAFVQGRCNLNYSEIPFALEFEDCLFELTPTFEGARTRSIRFDGCRLPGIDVEYASIDGGLWLDECEVGDEHSRRLWNEFLSRTKNHRAKLLHSIYRKQKFESWLERGGVWRLRGKRSGTDPRPDGEPPASAQSLARLVAESLSQDEINAETRRRGLVDVSGARINGQFSLRASHLHGSDQHRIVLKGDFMKVSHGMFLRGGFVAEGEVVLNGAEIGSRFDLSGSTIRNKGRTALSAQSLSVGGDLLMSAGHDGESFTAAGTVDLTRARVHGDIDLSKARLRPKNGRPGLDATAVRIDGDLVLSREDASSEFPSRILLERSRVGGRLIAAGAVLGPLAPAEPVPPAEEDPEGQNQNPDEPPPEDRSPLPVPWRPEETDRQESPRREGSDPYASGMGSRTGSNAPSPDDAVLYADSIEVQGGVDLRGALVHGDTWFVNAKITGDLVLEKAVLRNPGGVVFSGDGLQVTGDLLAESLEADGETRLSSSTVTRSVTLDHAVLTVQDDGRADGIQDHRALFAYGLMVGSDLSLRELRGKGQIGLAGATVTGVIDLTGAVLGPPVNTPVSVHDDTGTPVGRRFRFLRLREVARRASGASRRVLAGPDNDPVLLARQVTASVLVLREGEFNGLVDVRHAKTSLLDTEDARLRFGFLADGLVYDVLENALSPKQQIAVWGLRKSGFQPQPYEQLAAFYRRQGEDPDARLVLLTRQRHQVWADTSGRVFKRAVAFARKLLSFVFQDLTNGYGYVPIRAAGCFLFLLITGWLYFNDQQFKALKPEESPVLNKFFYTFDLLVPIFSFGQETAYTPKESPAREVAFFLVIAGWVLATTIVAGITRAISRQ